MTTRQEQALNMVRWLEKNWDLFELLTSCERERIETQEALNIARRMAADGYYELIFLFLYKYSPDMAIDRAVTAFFMDLLGREWERGGAEQLLQTLEEKLRIEMRVSESQA